MKRFFSGVVACAVTVLGTLSWPAGAAEPMPVPIGIVVMHGKGGSPNQHVSELASSLEGKGFLVANLEMPWSGRRNYDVDVAAAEKEVESALESLRSKGARKLFVSGHSQGGLFAVVYGSRHPVDGVIAIAPGGNVASPLFKDNIGSALAEARRLIDEGKGDQTVRLADYEGGRGAYPIVTRPVSYVSWFDPDGAMNEMAALRKMKPATPVLFIVPTGDYPGLQKTKTMRFGALPPNPMTKLFEPSSSHLGSPSASIDEIVKWATQVATAGSGS